LFQSRTRADRSGRDARRQRCRRIRNDRRMGLFIRSAGRISKKSIVLRGS
jgi:transposase